MRKFDLIFEVRVKGEGRLWEMDSLIIESKSYDGAMNKASEIIGRLEEAYGEAYTINHWIELRNNVA